MNTKMMIELFGYLGSTLVVVSMLMSSVIKLRVINTTGSVIFAIYALIIRSYPTALMNFCLVAINVYHLLKLRNTEKEFELVKLSPEDGYLSYFLSNYMKDIRKFFPGFSAEKGKWDTVYATFFGGSAVGVLLGTKNGAALDVEIDYSTPAYRDCSVGTYLYGQLKDDGIKALITRTDNAEHASYLQKMGFTRTEDGTYQKQLWAD